MSVDYLSEADQLIDIDLPFMHRDFTGHDKQKNTLLSVFGRQQHHHGYLLAGPRGIGKATLAHLCARYLLREEAVRESDVKDETFLMLNAGAHPNFYALCRAVNPKTKKYSQHIVVDQVRALGAWLHATAGMRGNRVVLVDPLEALNISAANALLKMIEEPPKITTFLLVSHAPGQLLSTLKSRCVRLDFKPLDDVSTSNIINSRLPNPALSATQIELILKQCAGNPRFGLALAGAQKDGTLFALIDLLSQLPHVSASQQYALAQKLGGAAQGIHFTTYVEIILSHLAQHAAHNALAAESWMQLQACFHQIQIYNLDRKQFFVLAIDWCQKAAKQAA